MSIFFFAVTTFLLQTVTKLFDYMNTGRIRPNQMCYSHGGIKLTLFTAVSTPNWPKRDSHVGEGNSRVL